MRCGCKKNQIGDMNFRFTLRLQAVENVLPNKELASELIVSPEMGMLQYDESLQQNGLLYADRYAKGS